MSSTSTSSPTLKLSSSLSNATLSHTASPWIRDVAITLSDVCKKKTRTQCQLFVVFKRANIIRSFNNLFLSLFDANLYIFQVDWEGERYCIILSSDLVAIVLANHLIVKVSCKRLNISCKAIQYYQEAHVFPVHCTDNIYPSM